MNWIKEISKSYVYLTEISSDEARSAAKYAQNKTTLHNLLAGQFPEIHQAASTTPFEMQIEIKNKDGKVKGIRHYKYKSVLDAMHMVASNKFHLSNQFLPDLIDRISKRGNIPSEVQHLNDIIDDHDEAISTISSHIERHLLENARQINPNIKGGTLTSSDVRQYMNLLDGAYSSGIGGNNVGIHPGLNIHHSNVSEEHHLASALHYTDNGAVPYRGPFHALLTTPTYMQPGHPLQFTFDAHEMNTDSPGGRAFSYEEL